MPGVLLRSVGGLQTRSQTPFAFSHALLPICMRGRLSQMQQKDLEILPHLNWVVTSQ